MPIAIGLLPVSEEFTTLYLCLNFLLVSWAFNDGELPVVRRLENWDAVICSDKKPCALSI
jgi:hypothetical protein